MKTSFWILKAFHKKHNFEIFKILLHNLIQLLHSPQEYYTTDMCPCKWSISRGTQVQFVWCDRFDSLRTKRMGSGWRNVIKKSSWDHQWGREGKKDGISAEMLAVMQSQQKSQQALRRNVKLMAFQNFPALEQGDQAYRHLPESVIGWGPNWEEDVPVSEMTSSAKATPESQQLEAIWQKYSRCGNASFSPEEDLGGTPQYPLHPFGGNVNLVIICL